jgi:signal transduction histidine kinase
MIGVSSTKGVDASQRPSGDGLGLTEIEALQRASLEALPHAVTMLEPVCSAEGDVVDAIVRYRNPIVATVRRDGRPRLGERIGALYLRPALALAAIRQALHTGETVRYDIANTGPDWDHNLVPEHFEVRYAPAGSMVVEVMIDRTADRRAEAMLAATEERFTAVIEGLSEGVLLFDPLFDADGALRDVRLRYANPAGRLLGGPRTAGEGGRPRVDHRPYFVPPSAEAWTTGRAVRHTIDNRDGRYAFLASAVIEVVVKRTGDTLTVVAADRTAEQSAKEALEATAAERLAATQRLAATLEQLAAVREEERRSLAVHLHDGAIQSLVATRLRLSGLAAGSPEPMAAHLAQVKEAIDDAIDELRSQTFELFPPSLEMSGLAAATTEQVERLGASGLSTRLRLDLPDDRLPAPVERLAFRTIQELLRNVAKHAKATSLTVSLELADDELVAVVTDDGTGFNPSSAETDRGFGLRSCRQLVQLAGGSLVATSGPGRGTAVTVRLPVVNEAGAL